MTTNSVQYDQVYADNDIRHKFHPQRRYVRVLYVDRDGERVLCEVLNSGRIVHISTKRLLQDNRRGYHLVAQTMTEFVVSTLKGK
jgi:hypothetical protein